VNTEVMGSVSATRFGSAPHPGFRFPARDYLTNRNEGTEFARRATNGSISEVTLALREVNCGEAGDFGMEQSGSSLGS
jgi:hypothetical protein